MLTLMNRLVATLSDTEPASDIEPVTTGRDSPLETLDIEHLFGLACSEKRTSVRIRSAPG